MALLERVTSLRAIPAKVLHLSETHQLGAVQKVHTQKSDKSLLYILGLLCLLIGFLFAYTGIFIYSQNYHFLAFGVLCIAIGILLPTLAIMTRDIAYECSDGILIMSGKGQQVRTILNWAQLREAREEDIYLHDGKHTLYFISYEADTALKEVALPFPALWKRCFAEARRAHNDYSPSF
jgi:hypothetical protein